MSKTASTFKNMLFTCIYQLCLIVAGFIIPKMLLSTYGASVHGLTSTASNLMNYVALLNAGLTAASVYSLYKPLHDQDHQRINEILSAIRKFYFRTGGIYAVAVLIIASILPLVVGGEVDHATVFFVMLSTGLFSTLDCFLASKSRALLQADQKLYITTICNTLVFILRFTIQVVLIQNNVSIILVQAVPAAVLFISAFLLNFYIKKHYPYVNNKAKPDFKALSRRWYALQHQIAGVVVNNVDIVVLTVFGDLIMVSIYSIYNLIFSNLYTMFTSIFSNGGIASFGHVIVSGDKDRLRHSFNQFEHIYYMLVTIVYSVCAVMLLPFISLYTSDVSNIKYADNQLAVLFILVSLLNNIRVPGGTLINAAGHFEETSKRAILEAVINLVASLVLYPFFGIYGVLLGTVASFLYRSTDIIIYSHRKILEVSLKRVILRIILIAIVVLCSVILFERILHLTANSWLTWVGGALAVGVFSSALTIILAFITDYRSTVSLFKTAKSVLFNRAG